MLRLALALLAGAAIAIAGLLIVGDSYPALLAVAVAAMLATAALAPHVFIRGERPSRHQRGPHARHP